MDKRRVKALAVHALLQLRNSEYRYSDVRKHDAIVSAAYLCLDDPKPYPYEFDRIWNGMRAAQPAFRRAHSCNSPGIVFA